MGWDNIIVLIIVLVIALVIIGKRQEQKQKKLKKEKYEAWEKRKDEERQLLEQKRKEEFDSRADNLMAKYRNLETVKKIMDGKFWVGQTEEQLIDSIGKPMDITQKVLKTKTKETWKYNKTGKSSYGLKIMLEDGEVVGWEQ